MKRYLLALILFTNYCFSQSNGITYQAVIYNPNGEELPGVDNPYAPLTNQDICLQFGILDVNKGLEYQEQVQVTTDAFGMVNLLIGTNTQTGGYASSFEKIVWSSDAKFLKVDIDTKGRCTNFIELSNQPFTYVPFAYYSPASDVPGPKGDKGDKGADGADGAMGASGPKGDKGDKGADGADGAMGATGPKGDKGDKGADGADGQDGMLPDGSNVGDTAYWDGSEWVVNSNHLFNDGSNVMIGTNQVDNSSALTVRASNKGILIPKLTQAQRDAITSPSTALLIFQTNQTPGFYYFDGVEWVGLINTNSTTNNNSGNNQSDTLIYTVDGF